jgi:hypothetical protein
MILDYLAKKHRFQDTIDKFERKYGMTYAEFEKRPATTENEVFEEWDDSIDWGAAVGMLEDVLKNIEEIKRGDIEIV